MHTLLRFILLGILGILFLNSCKPVEKLKTEYQSEIDSIIVSPTLVNKSTRYFDPFPVVFKDSNSISEIIGTISDIETPGYLCGYTGYIDFYVNDKVVLKGKYNHNCNTMVLSWFDSDKYFRQRITDDGLEFYKSLTISKLDSVGNNWYQW